MRQHQAQMGALHRQALPIMLLLKGPWRCAKSFRCVSTQVKAGPAIFSELCWRCGLPVVLATNSRAEGSRHCQQELCQPQNVLCSSLPCTTGC